MKHARDQYKVNERSMNWKTMVPKKLVPVDMGETNWEWTQVGKDRIQDLK